MKYFKLICLVAAMLISCGAARAGEDAPAPQIVNVLGRQTVSLDGMWKTIVDPFENGYYNYRMQPHGDASSYFADRDFDADRTVLYEYNFNTDRTLQVPGDWNTQRDGIGTYSTTSLSLTDAHSSISAQRTMRLS